MIPDRPKLRADLVVSRQEVGGRVRFIVKDPQTSRYFQCGDEEMQILRLMDGTRTLEDLRETCRTALDLDVEVEVLRDFVKQLLPLGLFEVEGGHGRALIQATASRRNWLMSALVWRVGVVRPHAFLKWLDGWTGILFTPYFVSVAMASLAGAIWTLTENAEALELDVGAHAGLVNLILLWVVAFVIIALHETAHGLTCTHFGGRVREMGFLLLFGMPCLYTDVSDAWLFPQRSRRIWVTLAGPFFEAFLWSLAVLAWRVTAPGTGPHLAALAGVLASGINLILGLNPLIKLDGYYLLSDWLEIPNLRARAFSYFGRFLWKHLTGAAEVLPADVPARQRGIFLTFAPLGLAYSTLLLGFFMWSLGRWLSDAYGGVGTAFSAAIVGTMLWGPTKKMAEGTQQLSKESRGAWRRPRAWITLAIVAGAIVGSNYVPRELEISGEFRLEPQQTTKVNSTMAGFIKSVKPRQGDHVRAGDLLVELDTTLVEADRAREEAKLEQAREELKRAQAGPRPEEIAQAEERKKTSEVKVDFARKVLDRVLSVGNSGVSQKEIDEKQAALAVAQGEAREAEAALHLMMAGPREQDIAVAQARVHELEVGVARYTILMEKAIVRAPMDGVVVTDRPERLLGAKVEEGATLVELMTLDRLQVDIAVPEADIDEIRRGQPISLKAASQPGRTFEGNVTEIAPVAREAAEKDPRRMVIVRCTVTNSDGALKPGMTGQARVSCGRSTLLRVFTRKFVRMIRVEFWW